MKILSRGKWLALALALLILGVASPLPVAGAESASLRIPGVALQSITDGVMFHSLKGGSLISEKGMGNWAWAAAPVYLPQGAVVTSVRMFYYDDNEIVNCNAIFAVCDFAIEDYFSTISWSSSGSSGLGYADSSAINHTVDYSKYGYLLLWQANADSGRTRLVGFQIFYTPPPSTPPPGKVVVIPLF